MAKTRLAAVSATLLSVADDSPAPTVTMPLLENTAAPPNPCDAGAGAAALGEHADPLLAPAVPITPFSCPWPYTPSDPNTLSAGSARVAHSLLPVVNTAVRRVAPVLSAPSITADPSAACAGTAPPSVSAAMTPPTAAAPAR